MVSSSPSSTRRAGDPGRGFGGVEPLARGPDLVDAHVEHFAAVLDRATAVGAPPGGTIRARRDEDALGTVLERDLAHPPAGVFPQRDHGRGAVPARSRAPHHAKGGQGQDGRAGVIGQDAGVACCPARAELGPVEQGSDDHRRADGTQDIGHVVDLGEVLAHERDEVSLRRPPRNASIGEEPPSLPTSGREGATRLPGGIGRSAARRATIGGACSGGCAPTARRSTHRCGPSCPGTGPALARAGGPRR